MRLGLGLSMGAIRAGGSSPPEITATQWRIRRLAHDEGVNYVGLAELHFNGERPTGGTASGSSSSSGTYVASNAFDGDVFSMWRTSLNAVVNSWIGYAFPEPISVSSVTLTAGSNNTSARWTPTEFAVEYFDGSSWVTLWTAATGAWSGGNVRTFDKP